MRVDICNLTYKYVKENYDYLWLKTRLSEARRFQKIDTLIIGSSHALNGIDTYCFHDAINCSMHTQDIHYDYECVKHIFGERKGNGGLVSGKCFIIFGYYIPFQDVSLGNGEFTLNMVRYIYRPVFTGQDDITWKSIMEAMSEEPLPSDLKDEIFHHAYDMVYSSRNYYNDLRVRSPLQRFPGKWKELSEEQRMEYARKRAEDHNKHLKYTASFENNKRLLKEMVDVLYKAGTKVVIVIPPFTKAYIRYIDKEMVKATSEMMTNTNAEFIDMNNIEAGFCDDDFVDTDHLNGRGAYKLSVFLANRYGK